MSIVNLVYQGVVSPTQRAGRKDGLYGPIDEGDRKWYVARGKAVCYIDDIVVPDLNNHNFGRYKITFKRYGTGMSNYSISGADHPHVYKGHACWGDLNALASTFLKTNDIENFVGIAETLLKSYNPANPYAGWWTTRWECAVCESNFFGTEGLLRCWNCGDAICGFCAIKCARGIPTRYLCDNGRCNKPLCTEPWRGEGDDPCEKCPVLDNVPGLHAVRIRRAESVQEEERPEQLSFTTITGPSGESIWVPTGGSTPRWDPAVSTSGSSYPRQYSGYTRSGPASQARGVDDNESEVDLNALPF